MVAASRIAFVALGVSIAQGALTTSCPSGQQLIANNKCCPGFAIVSGDNDTVCCVIDSNSSCKGIGLCGDGTTSSCKAKVETTDPDYDQKVQDALSGTSSSSSSAAGSATSTSTASSASSTASSDSSSDSGSGSSSSSDTKTGAGEANKAMLGMVVAIAAVPVVFYGI